MYLFNTALDFDIQGNIKQAIKYYTCSIEEGEEIEEAYLNLIVLLIEITFDYGKSLDLIQSNTIKEKNIQDLYILLENVLKTAIKKFPTTNEFLFWKYYCDNFYNDFDRKGITKIIERKEDSLVPYFYLYINDLSNNIPVRHYLDKIIELKKIINESNTHKHKYLKSLIDSAEVHS